MTGHGTPDVPLDGVPLPPGPPAAVRSAPSLPVPPPQFTPTRSGLRIRLPGSGDFGHVLEGLADALRDGPGVRGLAVTVDAAGRGLGVSQLREIEVLVLERHGAALLQVVEGQRDAGADGAATGGSGGGRRSSRRSPPAPSPTDLGLREETAAELTGRRAVRRVGRDHPADEGEPPQPAPAAAGGRSRGGSGRGGVGAARAAAVLAGPAAPAPAAAGLVSGATGLPDGTAPTLLLRRTLRSGQRVRFHGNVVVLGDVNPGAEIVAAGDIVVMGTLRGVAHAGATGSTEAIVAAFRLQPTQIRVGAVIGRAPDGLAPRPDIPEMARLRDGVLVIERYVPAPPD